MIECKKCGCENPAYELICNECASEFEPTAKECAELLSRAGEAMKSKDYRQAVDIYRFLAGNGNVDGERELALILERGLLLPKDIEMASRYFYSAARKGDALSAYRYSRLVSRLNGEAGEFWLEYSAIMGCEEAFSDASRLYSERGDEKSGAYYCALCALRGDSDSIIEMASRHLHGRGAPLNECYSKWYISRLDRIPLHARGLTRKLHSVNRAYTPPTPRFENRTSVLRSLIARAKKYDLRSVLLRLADLFAKSEAKDAVVDLAYLYIEGIEFEQDIQQGILLLKEAAKGGSAAGAKYLGDLYAQGKYAERDCQRAVKYYRQAAELGADGAYEAIGDVFYDGVITPPEPQLALKLYEAGAQKGDKGCAAKLRKVKADRERSYIRALEIEKTAPEEAFKLLEKSVSAGYSPANAKIALYYERGIGTDINRKKAFLHYKAAVDISDERAYEGLGRCYAYGIGTAFDFKLASKYLSLAKKDGSQTADRELYRLYEGKKRRMTRQLYATAMEIYYQGKLPQARELLTVCAEMGLGEAFYALGCMHELGITLPPSRELAVRFYSKAASLGYKDKRGATKQWLLRRSK